MDIAELGFELDTKGIKDGITALDKLDAAEEKVGKTADTSGGLIDRRFREASGGVGVLSSSFKLLSGVVGTIGFAAAVKGVTDYQTALSEVSTLVDTSTFDMAALGDAVTAQAKQFGAMPTANTKAFYQAISAGADTAEKAITAMEVANKLAIGGVTDSQTAIDGLTSAFNAWGAEANTMEQISDSLFVAVRAGKTTIEELSRSIGNVAPIASQAGVSLDEVNAATATLTAGGMSTSVAMNGLRAIMASVIKPTEGAKKAAEEMGVEFDILSTNGLPAFMEHVAEKTGGSKEKLGELFTGVEALAPAMALTGAGAQKFADVMQEMADKAGASQTAFDKMYATFGVQSQRLVAGITAEFLAIASAIAVEVTPAIEWLANNVTPAFDAMKRGVAALVQVFEPVTRQIDIFFTALNQGAGSMDEAAKFAAIADTSMAKFAASVRTALDIVKPIVPYLDDLAIALTAMAATRTGVTLAIGALAGFGKLVALINPVNVAILAVAAGAVAIQKNWEGITNWWSWLWGDLRGDAQNFSDWWDSTSYKEKVLTVHAIAIDAALKVAEKFFNWWNQSTLKKHAPEFIVDGIAAAEKVIGRFFQWWHALDLKAAIIEFELPSLADVSRTALAIGSAVYDGIKAGAGSLSRFFGDWIQDAIDWVKNKLGIASPSRVFTQIGTWIMEGLANGIKGAFRLVTDSFSSLIDQITGWWQNLSFPDLELSIATDGIDKARALLDQFTNYWRSTAFGQKTAEIATQGIEGAKRLISEFVDFWKRPLAALIPEIKTLSIDKAVTVVKGFYSDWLSYDFKGKAVEIITTSIDTAKRIVGDLFTLWDRSTLKDKTPKIIVDGIDRVRDLVSGFFDLWERNRLSEKVASIATAGITAAQVIVGRFFDLWRDNKLTEKIATIATAGIDKAKTIAADLFDLWNRSELKEKIASVSANALDAVKDKATKFFDFWKNSTLEEKIGWVRTDGVDAFKAEWANLGAWFQTLAKDLLSNFVSEAGSFNWSQLGDAIGSGLGSLSGYLFSIGADLIKRIFDGASDSTAIKDFVVGFFDGFTTSFKAEGAVGIQAVKDLGADMIDGLLASIAGWEARFEARVHELIDGALAGIEGFEDRFEARVHEFIQAMIDAIKGKAAEVITAVKTLGADIIDGLKDGFLSKFDDLKSTITDKLSSLPLIGDKFGGEITESFADAIAAASPDVTRSLDRVIDVVDAGWGKLNKEMTLKAAILGGHIPDGLAQGILNGSLTVEQATKQLAEGGVIEPFKDGMLIRSPSRVMFAFGEFVSQGVADGIASKAGVVIGASQTLAKAAADAFNSLKDAVEGEIIALTQGEEAFRRYELEQQGVVDGAQDFIVAAERKRDALQEEADTAERVAQVTADAQHELRLAAVELYAGADAAASAALQWDGFTKAEADSVVATQNAAQAMRDQAIAAEEAAQRQEDFVTSLGDTIRNADSFKDVLRNIGDATRSWLKDLGATFAENEFKLLFGMGDTSSVEGGFSGLMGRLKDTFAKGFAEIDTLTGGLLTKLKDGFLKGLGGLFDGGGISGIFAKLKDTVLGGLSNAFGSADGGGGITGIFTALKDKVLGGLSNAFGGGGGGGGLTGIFDTVKSAAGGLFSSLSSGGGILSKITGLFGGGSGGGLFSTLSSGGGIISKVAGLFGGASGGLGSLTGALGGLGGGITAMLGPIGLATGAGALAVGGLKHLSEVFGGYKKHAEGFQIEVNDGDVLGNSIEILKKKTIFFKNKYKEELGKMDDETMNMFLDFFKGLETTIGGASANLGIAGADAILENFEIATTRFIGSGEEIQQQLAQFQEDTTINAWRSAYDRATPELQALVDQNVDITTASAEEIGAVFADLGNIAGVLVPQLDLLGQTTGLSFEQSIAAGAALVEEMGSVEAAQQTLAAMIASSVPVYEQNQARIEELQSSIYDWNESIGLGNASITASASELDSYTGTLTDNTAANANALAQVAAFTTVIDENTGAVELDRAALAAHVAGLDQSTQAGQAAADSALALSAAFGDVTTASTLSQASLAAIEQELAGMGVASAQAQSILDQHTTSVDAATGAVTVNTDSLNAQIASTNALSNTYVGQSDVLNSVIAGIDSVSGSYQEMTLEGGRVRDTVTLTAQQMQNINAEFAAAGEAGSKAAAQLAHQVISTDAVTGAVTLNMTALNGNAAALNDIADGFRTTTTATDALTGALGLTTTTIDQTAISAINTEQQLLDYIGTLDLSTTAGQEAAAAATAQYQAIVELEALQAQQTQTVKDFSGAMQKLGIDFDATHPSALAAADGLAELLGGMDALQSASNKFYNEFYSNEERMQIELANHAATVNVLNQELQAAGLGAVTTRDDFRSLIESMDAGNPVHQQMIANLLQSQDAFIAVADSGRTTNDIINSLPDNLTNATTQMVQDTVAMGDQIVNVNQVTNAAVVAGSTAASDAVIAANDAQLTSTVATQGEIVNAVITGNSEVIQSTATLAQQMVAEAQAAGDERLAIEIQQGQQRLAEAQASGINILGVATDLNSTILTAAQTHGVERLAEIAGTNAAILSDTQVTQAALAEESQRTRDVLYADTVALGESLIAEANTRNDTLLAQQIAMSIASINEAQTNGDNVLAVAADVSTQLLTVAQQHGNAEIIEQAATNQILLQQAQATNQQQIAEQAASLSAQQIATQNFLAQQVAMAADAQSAMSEASRAWWQSMSADSIAAQNEMLASSRAAYDQRRADIAAGIAEETAMETSRQDRLRALRESGISLNLSNLQAYLNGDTTLRQAANTTNLSNSQAHANADVALKQAANVTNLATVQNFTTTDTTLRRDAANATLQATRDANAAIVTDAHAAGAAVVATNQNTNAAVVSGTQAAGAAITSEFNQANANATREVQALNNSITSEISNAATNAGREVERLGGTVINEFGIMGREAGNRTTQMNRDVVGDAGEMLQGTIRSTGSMVQFFLGALNTLIRGTNDFAQTAVRIGDTLAHAAWAAGRAATDASNAARSAANANYNTINGSHRSGLGTVPFDGYIAELHKGEMILPPELSEWVRKAAGSAADSMVTVDSAMVDAIGNTQSSMTYAPPPMPPQPVDTEKTISLKVEPVAVSAIESAADAMVTVDDSVVEAINDSTFDQVPDAGISKDYFADKMESLISAVTTNDRSTGIQPVPTATIESAADTMVTVEAAEAQKADDSVVSLIAAMAERSDYMADYHNEPMDASYSAQMPNANSNNADLLAEVVKLREEIEGMRKDGNESAKMSQDTLNSIDSHSQQQVNSLDKVSDETRRSARRNDQRVAVL